MKQDLCDSLRWPMLTNLLASNCLFARPAAGAPAIAFHVPAAASTFARLPFDSCYFSAVAFVAAGFVAVAFFVPVRLFANSHVPPDRLDLNATPIYTLQYWRP